MALATAADVVKALGRDLTADEDEQVEHQLDEASDLVLGYLKWGVNCPQPDPIPDAVKRVTASIVAAVFDRPKSQPKNAEQLNAGDYGVRFTVDSTSNGPWLTGSQKMRLEPFRCSMRSVSLVSDRYAT